MAGWTGRWRGLVLLAACGGGAARAQGLVPVMQAAPGRETVSLAAAAGVQAVLRQFAEQAGVIFTGEVVAVRPGQTDGIGYASGVVEVEFRVDEAVRGCAPGTYTLREWGGLWGAAGEQRYRVGQRALVFLHAPGASGLSSPVAGMDGVVPMVGAGVAPGPLDTTTAAGVWTLDLRWLQTHAAARSHAVLPVVPVETVGGKQEQGAAEAATMSSTAALALLRGWEEERRAAR